MREQELADTFGSFSLVLAGRRVVRHLYFLRGWPHRMLGVLAEGHFADETLGLFKKDLEAYRALCEVPEAKVLQRLKLRTPFNGISVDQSVQDSSCHPRERR